ncbi:hypothetical protein [Nitratidesulfovibrio vulgaris]|uniref:Uncharacterized protein n=1 Tax=Nitratidesulfovibrio vulgaris (strain ATCC 29579 / DSM 644 / CCUG 34227 / NCIMB 8303 / VKM B-1760 / Hildenborough) TaxID=882 RepID=Q72C06_NITV2|nr:hypothetical protein [Nitratidesulfovibrio vulgaris]AAS95956.1 hypothetical protein DVU_1478 [Nitratidesulfovibrio vulgaris str. Hildenborough]ADP86966.1 hypothetical protein Deval_1815 [Nitratidesulfovibrio vulgaris RCH1]
MKRRTAELIRILQGRKMLTHMNIMIGNARHCLVNWISQNSSLCALRDLNFEVSFPYCVQYAQALYILRYYPAYFAENYMLYTTLSEMGCRRPDIASIGCGSMVDGAAASYVFDSFTYHGYDLNDWSFKGLTPNGGSVIFHNGDVFSETSWDVERDVFCFSRSLRDIGDNIDGLRCAVESTDFKYDNIYICATYNSAPDEIRRSHRGMLRRFASFFEDYDIINEDYWDSGRLSKRGRAIRSHLDWWVHSESSFCSSLLSRCRDMLSDGCATSDCETNLQKKPILNVTELGFEVLHLLRR